MNNLLNKTLGSITRGRVGSNLNKAGNIVLVVAEMKV
jgi:hypothetical protein